MKFFKRFRERLIPRKGFQKYLLYAIGEIFLVVVGILIALTVNNKNQEYQKEALNRQKSQKLLKLMASDTLEMSNVLKAWDYLEETIDTILYLTPSNGPILNCNGCPDMMISATLPTLDDTVLNLVASMDTENVISEEIFQKIAAHYKFLSQSRDFNDEVITKTMFDNLNYLKDTKPWFADYITQSKCDEDCKTYFSESSDFRNRIAYLQLVMYDSYYAELFRAKKLIAKDIEDLHKLLKE
ncbi:hypothetical protein EAX61_07695 [Dokdonia sinensis]|uniref:Uncharacterized protein n=1 Tax=Dokdonia sinensis TaxID=2479847 RepID=A0A3M0G3A8_9FLAO|nr:hypothetical protein [Dokdonia sinensis]RMB59461.1 hypothetical protein EAX61_07695 [Dokdonia sinensis]